MATQFEKFKTTLFKMFMLDQAELDFGIYRIMNQKKDEITNFLNVILPKQVKTLLTENTSAHTSELQKQLDETIRQVKELGYDPDTNPKVNNLREEIAKSGSSDELENTVYSHLTTFFSRYYEGGDFISLRRYKKDVYAIPYEGEEVKLHWANADQYYIKTGEYFRNYSFKLSGTKRVEFTLKDVTTEQNNNLAQNNMERRFAIYEEEPITIDEDTLHLNFTYELYPKATKQKSLIEKAFEKVRDLVPVEFGELFSLRPTENNRNRTLLQKHLADYVARNTFDYFIHKDLHGFLTRELDFYIKNEILVIDDINSRSTEEFVSHLTVIKTIKAVGASLIQFLSQLEEFQKRLWLKKKFVVQADYCITLDRVPEELYAEICANDRQREEWVRLFAIDEIKGERMFSEAYSVPLTEQFLKENPFLVLDTVFFDAEFKQKLLSSIDNLDEQCDGLLINSENFQALQLLQEKYKEQVKCIYIDPPYNTSASKIAYKNNYEHSSWLSLMYDRILGGQQLLSLDGAISIAIDDAEGFRLGMILNSVFGEINKLGQIVVVQNPGGRHDDKYIATAHEYCMYYGKNTEYTTTNLLPLEEEDIASFKYKDEKGLFRTREFRRSGNNSTKEARPKMYYPILIKNGCIELITSEEFEKIYQGNSFNIEFIKELNFKYKSLGYEILYPIDPQGVHRVWRWGMSSLKDRLDDVFVEKKQDKYIVKVKDRLNNKEGLKPKSVWYKPRYTGVVGTDTIKSMGFENMFSYPKSPYTVSDSVDILSDFNSYALDYFAGSGTTGHAVINLNREDNGKRKYILVEMGTYFDTVTKPRIQKVIYSEDWNKGKPVSRKGSSHCFKYMRLEQYEDTLNNLMIKQNTLNNDGEFYDGFLLGYMLDLETRDSLFNLKWFENPFNMKLRITRNNEMTEEKIDLVETFNYLIGLYVDQIAYPKDGICTVVGRTRKGKKSLIIWRDCTKVSNEQLNDFFRRSAYSVRDNEFDVIYVNGDNNLENLRTEEDTWKVVLIEQEFNKQMFNC